MPVPTPVAVNMVSTLLSVAPINVKSVAAPALPSSVADIIIYSLPISKFPAVLGKSALARKAASNTGGTT